MYEDLFDKYLSGSMTPEERRRLAALLQEHPEVGEALARHIREVSLIVRVGLQLEASGAAMASEVGSRTRRARRRPESSARRPWTPALVSAGALSGIAAILFVLASGRDRSGRLQPEGSRGPEGPRPGLSGRDAQREPVPWPSQEDRAVLEEERQRAGERLAELEREKARPDDGRRKAEEEEVRRKLEAQLAQVEKARREDEAALARAEAEKQKQEEAAGQAKRGETVVAPATLEWAEGDVFRVVGSQRVRANAGEGLAAGEGVEVPAEGLAAVRFPDKTRIFLGARTRVQELFDLAAGRPDRGRRVVVSRGVVWAEVGKQPPDQPMIFVAPQGEAKVLGTTLRLVADADGNGTLRLDVLEGRVQLKRRVDGKTVDVPSGYFAVVARGVQLAAHPRRTTRVTPQALYLFDEEGGTVVHDLAKGRRPLDLKIENESAFRWVPGALEVVSPGALSSSKAATKIIEACKRTNEVTLEAWISPARKAPALPSMPGRIVTLSSDASNQNFALEQGAPSGTPASIYHVRLRTTETTNAGWPRGSAGFPLLAHSPEGSVEPRLTHVVYTRSASGEGLLHLDGVEVGRKTVLGTLSAWNDAYRVILANEFGEARPWLGKYHYLAIYDRALTAAEVKLHSQAGPD